MHDDLLRIRWKARRKRASAACREVRGRRTLKEKTSPLGRRSSRWTPPGCPARTTHGRPLRFRIDVIEPSHPRAKDPPLAGHHLCVANEGEREERFRRLFVGEYRYLLAYALRRTSNLADAQDVVAETFTVAWRRLEDAPNAKAVRPWLYAIAARTIANQRRSQRRLQALRQRLRGQRPLLPDRPDTSAGNDEWQAVLAALARLPSGEQELLRLIAWEDLSQAELAAVLGCSENAAAIRLHRARRRLQAELAKEPGPSGQMEVRTHQTEET
jgi:RNA polymerase sigma factor (sigma-70 family)